MSHSRRQNPPTSVKQILVRDYNWRMGNLQRLRRCVYVLTDGRDIVAHRLVEAEIFRQEVLHKDRLAAIAIGNYHYDQVTSDAYHRIEASKVKTHA